jgi:hypothetical protein
MAVLGPRTTGSLPNEPRGRLYIDAGSGRPDISWPATAMTPGTRVTVVQDPSWPGP